jgi:hypothetical protein
MNMVVISCLVGKVDGSSHLLLVREVHGSLSLRHNRHAAFITAWNARTTVGAHVLKKQKLCCRKPPRILVNCCSGSSLMEHWRPGRLSELTG